MKKLKDSSGSALLWTILVLGMLTVLCTAVLTISMTYTKRNQNQNQNQQTYYTALSAVDLVAKQFTGIHEKESSQYKIIEKLKDGDPIAITVIRLPDEMGDCAVTMQLRNEDIVITADAQRNGMTYRLSGIMKGVVVEPPEPDPENPDQPAPEEPDPPAPEEPDPDNPVDPDAPVEPEEVIMDWSLSAYENR